MRDTLQEKTLKELGETDSDALFPIGPVDVKSVAKAGLRNFDKGEEDRITTASTDFGLTSTTHEEVFDVERDVAD